MERRFTSGGLTAVELEAFEPGEAVGIVAPPVGSAPMTPAQLLSTRVATDLTIELRRGGLQSGLVDKGMYRAGGRAGYGDFVSGPCATDTEGRVACTGTPGLLVTSTVADPLRAVSVPVSVPVSLLVFALVSVAVSLPVSLLVPPPSSEVHAKLESEAREASASASETWRDDMPAG